ncbi:glycosyltransferase [Dickeya fangzhongdai]|uniref:glycosyltransferase n=1 Tax=Dickeya fangzhongdai TaxID=1778540 RepID=UPI001EFAE614|nr:glycosyltransferase [Dickeya fangzhongdai]ULR32467.1 glycosyltransferase [Dickeya fangzhongdai]
MKKNILFATHNSEDDTDGVWKKIKAQVSALRGMGASVDFFYMKEGVIILDDGVIKSEFPIGQKGKYFFYFSLANHIKSERKAYDLAYIRKPHGGLFVIFLPYLLGALKRINTYIVIEIPTYPYKKELNSIKAIIFNIVFDMTLPFFRGKVDEVLYMGDKIETIWGVKATRISNGIDIDNIKSIKEKDKCSSDFIIVGVANLEFWHGYDRIVEGIKKYTGKRSVIFNIVGYSQPEYNRLKEMVLKYKIENNVVFHGRKSGGELDVLLEDADVCVDALGRHRSGNNTNSSIKSKEYAARGLPFIKSHVDYSFGDEEFIFQVPANDSAVDIERIIQWRGSLSEGFSIREREFALSKLTWDKQLKFLLEGK